jgi:hypothetical protein
MNLRLEYLRDVLSYDPETGVWVWLNPPNHNTRLRGKVAGTVRQDGYRKIRINGVPYYSGRLAWFYMTGEWPKEEVDHRDRDPSNDKWSNLREATSSQNKYNRKPDDLRGVYRSGSKWWAMAGRNNYLGIFDTLEDAVTARNAEALRLGGAFVP